MRTATTLFAGLGAAALILGPLATAASASADGPSDDERVDSYAARLTVGADGSVAVREEISYDFGREGHHGLERFLPVQAPHDQTHDRRYPVRDLQVTSPTGAATQVSTETDDGFLDVRIGDPAANDVTGRETYVLTYTVPAVVDRVDGGLQLAYDVVGTGWEVPIDRVDVTLETPAAVTDPRCFQGAEGSTDRCSAATTATGATFAATGLGPKRGVTIAAALPTGSLDPAAPLLVDTFSPARAFTADGPTLGAAAGVLALGAGGIALARRRPEARATQGAVGVTDVPPGVLGTVVHGGARTVDVVATLLDLAQRGHLGLEEVTAPDGSVVDWDLTRTDSPDPLAPAERRLLDTVFADGDDTSLSAVRTTARAGTGLTKDLIEDDAVARGLFTDRPRNVLRRWALRSVRVALAGGALTLVLALWTTHALVGVAVTVVGLLALVAGFAGAAPSPLTARGREIRRQAGEFAATLARYGDADALADGGAPHRFARLVPYAVALDATDAWVAGARALQAADAPLPAPSWYSGRAHEGSTFNVALFAGTMGGFSASTTDALSAAPPATASSGSFSGGGGFTGGGAGGGGGGSW
ncbi:DUF2207 domain-containing protein [Kineococcus sp. R86509]|uniref:DUF2207 domain-containing protein n=1 Tax=Kineococcus sp. R86509 TaxID=3093851 RepID=UPI0036D249B6